MNDMSQKGITVCNKNLKNLLFRKREVRVWTSSKSAHSQYAKENLFRYLLNPDPVVFFCFFFVFKIMLPAVIGSTFTEIQFFEPHFIISADGK